MALFKKKIKIFIVDDHKIVLDGLESLLNREDDMTVCGVSENGNGMNAAVKNLDPDVVIVDIGLGKGLGGIDLTSEIHERHPKIKILVLSQYDENIYAERAVRAGAVGYVMKSEATKTLVSAIRHIMTGRIYLSENAMSKMLIDVVHNRPFKSGQVEALSNREFEIFSLMGSGHKSSEIAKKLLISVRTVEVHRLHIKEKFNMKSIADVVKYSIEWHKTH